MRVFFIAHSKYFGVHTIFASLSAFLMDEMKFERDQVNDRKIRFEME